MVLKACCVAVILLFVETCFADSPPDFGKTYMVQGVLQLPYAEIVEPFAAYYDSTNNRSRIDYYGGMVVSIQRADQKPFGKTYKIAPMSTYTVKNKNSCFQVNGTQNFTVSIQGVLPDLSKFKKVGMEIVGGVKCEKWQLIDMEWKKSSTYTMWVEVGTRKPVRYMMMGYDSLLGSHFDKYILDYSSNFISNKPIPEQQFAVPENLTCAGFPGPGDKSRIILFNPMHEYINRYDDHVHESFDNFKKVHHKEYSSHKESELRKQTFRQNLRFINSKNRAGLTFTLAVNHLADRSEGEMRLMRGYTYTPNHGGLPFDMSKYNLSDVPDQLDWRLYGAVTPVKDQAVCGSCWSFGTTGTIEGANFLKTGTLVRLSQQELMDCSWGEGNNGCDGGEDFRSYMWIMKNGGITSEGQYGQYLAVDGRCHSDNVKPVVNLSGYVNVTSGDLQALKVALAKEGPISVSIDAALKSFSFYANGVFYDPTCGNKPDDLDHSVLSINVCICR
ncbi:digestive cysteine proteinase 2-like isoform X2 [Gigantopelta aegis]|uniref:digestive cysteine proteinase 2-like isoform X2 n=1 Tax=Gigantopelta aegis TaxID=1735272 RepID=UPI001B8875AF|nr:digestive cysteine proteinase 2-like isoform X2 [Gigantopelta aegis]